VKIYKPCPNCNGEGQVPISHPQNHITLTMTGQCSYETCKQCEGTGKGDIMGIVDDLSHKKGPTI
jgi:DnaJ-class molecular chaperone